MRASRRPSKSIRAAAALALLAIALSACKPAGLPDATSPPAQLYASKCGNCHKPYNPHEMTASMWDTQVTMMEVKMQAAGLPPLTSDERESIVDYLKRNAGTQ
jgi:hypothetical protein